ncbi:hypothetical protein L345_09660, partial [Ophiophagus hannah]
MLTWIMYFIMHRDLLQLFKVIILPEEHNLFLLQLNDFELKPQHKCYKELGPISFQLKRYLSTSFVKSYRTYLERRFLSLPHHHLALSEEQNFYQIKNHAVYNGRYNTANFIRKAKAANEEMTNNISKAHKQMALQQ